MMFGSRLFFFVALFFSSLPAWSAGQSQVPKMKLFREFKKEQASELARLDAAIKSEAKELKKSQTDRQKEWEDEAKAERRKFFEENAEPAKRKSYIQDFIKKRDSLKRAFAEESKEQRTEHAARRNALQKDQSEKLKEFQSALERGEEPSPDLWPEK